MRILAIGLDCAAPEILLADQRLTNVRRLMELGCYGRLESVVPPITVPAWMCMATSQDPGRLGVYGFRNRSDHSYDGLKIVNSRHVRGHTLWDQIACEGGRANVVAVPPNFPPRKVNGVSVGCFMTPDAANGTFAHPPEMSEEIRRLVGEYPVDVSGFRTHEKDWLKDQIHAMTRKHFEVIRHLMTHTDWDYFQFVEIGLDRIQHGFWKSHDPEHRGHDADSPYREVVRDYYLLLDEEIGRLLELLDDDTLVVILSDHGAQRLDGGFCVNEWLVGEGDLALHSYPQQVTPFSQLDVDWSRTRAWSEGGYYARVFLNVQGREPEGTIAPRDYEKVRDDLKARFEALTDDRGRRMNSRVFRPEEIYRDVRNVAPDLIVLFDDLYWRSVGGVGYPGLHVQENDTGPDDCNHAQFGAFVLSGLSSPLQGEIQGAHLLDLAPTLLELGGYDTPESMQGESLVSKGGRAPVAADVSFSEEEIIRQRLSGLGYIS